jgi:hypothetical protein
LVFYEARELGELSPGIDGRERGRPDAGRRFDPEVLDETIRVSGLALVPTKPAANEGVVLARDLTRGSER